MSGAQEIILSTSGQIGIVVSKQLKPVYREIAGLLGVPCTEPSSEPKLFSVCEAILADGISLEELGFLLKSEEDTPKHKPLILICGPVSGQNPDLRLRRFSFDLGQAGTRLLMKGREHTEKDVDAPTLDLMLEEVREVLCREIKNYLELPPIPWGYTYAMTLTHDIDILSLKEMPIARTFLGYFYRSSILNWKRWHAGKVTAKEHFQTIWEMARTGAAKLRIGQDVWQRALPRLLELEKHLGVRSSLYFMPFPNKPGILPKGIGSEVQEDAPANRASFYDIADYQGLLNSLEDGGWEAGVHGIDAWHNVPAARAEQCRISALTGRQETGVRMHWLYFQSPESFQVLEAGGFLYDATCGFNEVVGFRAGTLQPYHPINCQTLWELPLHIQDGALMGEEHQDLNREEAFQQANLILDWAKRLGGAVSLLWHNQSFTAPRFWGEVYERLIAQGRTDGAWIAIPREVLGWYDLRRRCQAVLTVQGTRWEISCSLPEQDQRRLAKSGAAAQISSVPPVRIRIHLDPQRIRSASVPYEVGTNYIDFPGQALVTLEVEGGES